MNTNIIFHPTRRLSHAVSLLLAAAVAHWTIAATAHGQILQPNFISGAFGDHTIAAPIWGASLGWTRNHALRFTPTGSSSASQLLNIATRLRVQSGDNTLIGGFIIGGTQPKTVIIRGIGPSLSSFFSGVLADPFIEVHGSSGELLATNDNWNDATTRQQIIDSGLAPTNNLESALWGVINPGAYTVVVRGVNNTTGIGLVEVYDLDQTVDAKLANISTRGFVETGDNVMIGGIVVGPPGAGNSNILVRAIGPSLANFGITNPLPDPTLTLHDANGAVIASNDNWQDGEPTGIQTTGIAPVNDSESAILSTVSPGNYTAVVRGANNGTGVGLVEIYSLPLRVTSGGSGSSPPFKPMYLEGTGFNPTAAISARFFDANSFSVKVPVVDVIPSRLTALAPVYLTPGTGVIGAATVDWEVIQETVGGAVISEVHSGLQLQTLPVLQSMPGKATLSLLVAIVDLANNHLATVTGTPWDTPQVRSAISNQITQLNTLITKVQNLVADPAQTFSLGTASSIPLTVHQSDLGAVDRMLVGWLQAISQNTGPARPNTPVLQHMQVPMTTGCGTVPAGNYAQAATQPDQDLIPFAREFVYAPRQNVLCNQVEPFATAFNVIGGGGAIALGILALAGAPKIALALPAAALLYVTLQQAGGMIALGGALNQTSPSARQLVVNGVDKLEDLIRAPFPDLYPEWTGTLRDMSEGAQSLYDAFTSAIITPPATPTPTPSSTPSSTPTPTPTSIYRGSFSGFTDDTCSFPGTCTLRDTVSGQVTLAISGGGTPANPYTGTGNVNGSLVITVTSGGQSCHGDTIPASGAGIVSGSAGRVLAHMEFDVAGSHVTLDFTNGVFNGNTLTGDVRIDLGFCVPDITGPITLIEQ